MSISGVEIKNKNPIPATRAEEATPTAIEQPKTRKKRTTQPESRVGKLRAQIRMAALVDKACVIVTELDKWGLDELNIAIQARCMVISAEK